MIIKTYCARMDHGGCGLRVHVKDGKIVKVEGDPDSSLNQGTICAKGIAQVERLNHPDRLHHPLKRIGERGEGKWERISWEEALTTISQRILRTDRRSITFAQGTPKGLELYMMIRLANLLKVPTVITPGSICHMPRETAAVITCGFFPVPDYDHPPALVIVWGSNLFQTNEEGIIGSQLRRALDRGAKLVVIDPRRTQSSNRADLWIQPRPGTDLPLALGMLKGIVEEGLYDRAFIDQWTVGFPELLEHLKDYSLKGLAEATWVPEEKIAEAARLYARIRPACVQWGNAIEHSVHSVQTARALMILKAITGNLDSPGGNVNCPSPPTLRPGDFVQSKSFPEKREPPDPVVLLHPQTAEGMGVKDGDWVHIETPGGTIRQKASLDSDLDPRVVVAAYGWWFPERRDLELSGWKESNINILTENDPPYDQTIGSTNLRAIPCRVYKE
jgi:anaerobic selenocysteine-containing dehydrogenase